MMVVCHVKDCEFLGDTSDEWIRHYEKEHFKHEE